MSYLVRAKKMVSYLFGCLALNGPQRELFGTFQVIEVNKISQEIFGNQPIFNFVSELILLRSGKNFKPCIQNLVGTDEQPGPFYMGVPSGQSTWPSASPH